MPYLTSKEALSCEVLPKHLAVVGSGAVALELAQAYQRLDTQITLIARSQLLSHDEPAIGHCLQQVLVSEGMRVLCDTQVHAVSYADTQFTLQLAEQVISCDQLLIATGRKAILAL